jgi:SAM-dependent methyltransferase
VCIGNAGSSFNINLPSDIEWRLWIDRWDQMQDWYISHRRKRFELMMALLESTQKEVRRILDLGCGTGSLMLAALEKFPAARVFGIDFDPTLLPLAEKRLFRFNERVRLIQADLRDNSWLRTVPGDMNAVISATSLHWLSPEQLSRLYSQIGRIMHQGGIFLNADHVGSSNPEIQAGWEEHREQMRKEQKCGRADDWEGFWKDYKQALKIDIKELRRKLEQPWEGSEKGLPLEWHFEKLRANGFEAIDCFWRCDCDAVFGGIRQRI